tara:strand:+ start:2519 stop:2806 length:288 start_codon:yes stop_codon:yes gene_type:complete
MIERKNQIITTGEDVIMRMLKVVFLFAFLVESAKTAIASVKEGHKNCWKNSDKNECCELRQKSFEIKNSGLNISAEEPDVFDLNPYLDHMGGSFR